MCWPLTPVNAVGVPVDAVDAVRSLGGAANTAIFDADHLAPVSGDVVFVVAVAARANHCVAESRTV